jgi:hypothetical protein
MHTVGAWVYQSCGGVLLKLRASYRKSTATFVAYDMDEWIGPRRGFAEPSLGCGELPEHGNSGKRRVQIFNSPSDKLRQLRFRQLRKSLVVLTQCVTGDRSAKGVTELTECNGENVKFHHD